MTYLVASVSVTVFFWVFNRERNLDDRMREEAVATMGVESRPSYALLRPVLERHLAFGVVVSSGLRDDGRNDGDEIGYHRQSLLGILSI
jgi:hypothetical protein